MGEKPMDLVMKLLVAYDETADDRFEEAATCIREMVEWRKASDTKPQDEQQVWVNLSYPGGMVSQGYAIWSDDDGWWFDVETDGTLLSRKAAIEQGLEAAEVTHWLPLPPAPGAEA